MRSLFLILACLSACTLDVSAPVPTPVINIKCVEVIVEGTPVVLQCDAGALKSDAGDAGGEQ